MKNNAQSVEKVEFGKVKLFNRDGGFGFVLDDEGKAVRIDAKDGPRFIEAGVDTPRFGEDLIKTTPYGGEQVVFVRDHKSGRTASFWSYAKVYDKVTAQIESRPKFRVLRKIFFRGVGGDWGESFEGSAENLAFESPRDGLHISDKDKMAPTFWDGRLVTQNRFQVWKENEGWVDYSTDPRPFPKGELFRAMLTVVMGESYQVAFGTAEEIMWKHPLDNPYDELAPMNPVNTGMLLYWQCREKKEWVPCSDPRRNQSALPVGWDKPATAVPLKTNGAVSVVPSQKPKAFILKGFSGLGDLTGHLVGKAA
jgi:hypothetical protein